MIKRLLTTEFVKLLLIVWDRWIELHKYWRDPSMLVQYNYVAGHSFANETPSHWNAADPSLQHQFPVRYVEWIVQSSFYASTNSKLFIGLKLFAVFISVARKLTNAYVIAEQWVQEKSRRKNRSESNRFSWMGRNKIILGRTQKIPKLGVVLLQIT